MKIKTFFYIWLFLFSLSCSEIPPKPQIPTDMKQSPPVFEMFGYARCSNCPVVEEAMDSLKRLYGDSIIVIQYHLRILGDTLSPEEVTSRANFYQVNNVAPVIFINGIYRITGAPDSAYSTFHSYFLNSQRKPLIFTTETDTIGDSLIIKIILPDTITIDTTDSIYTVVTQDSIYFAQPGAPDSLFNNVSRFIHSGKLQYENIFKIPLLDRPYFINIFIQNPTTHEIKSAWVIKED